MAQTNKYFNIDEVALPGIAIIELTLAHDLDIEAFNEITAQLIDRWPVPAGRNVIVDLRQTHYLGSVLLGLLINIRQRTRANRGAIAVAAAPARLIETMRMSNLDRLLPVGATREQALSKL